MRIYTDEIDTAAVGFQDNCIALYINPDFFAKQLKGISQRVAVVKHETLHLVFNICFINCQTKVEDRTHSKKRGETEQPDE